MATVTKPTYDILDKAFNYFNTHLWNDALPACAVTLQRKKGSYGYHATGHMFDRNGQQIAEIALNPDTFENRSMTDVLSTLVHEMVHLWQWRYGEPSRNGYHNKEWAAEMIRVGLMPTDTGAEGGKTTGQRMTHYIVEDGLFAELCRTFLADNADDISFYSRQETKSKQAKAKRASKTKYTCECGTNIWGKPGLDILCGECGQPFFEEDGEGEEGDEDSADR